MGDSDSDDSDEWGKEELDVPLPAISAAKQAPAQTASQSKDDDDDNDNDDDWASPIPKAQAENSFKTKVVSTAMAGEPMFIVDMTRLTDSKIHSKFDRNSVNDVSAASTLRKQIEGKYHEYGRDTKLLSEGIVIPCSTNVYRDALARLRDEREGHYFAAIFPLNKSK